MSVSSRSSHQIECRRRTTGVTADTDRAGDRETGCERSTVDKRARAVVVVVVVVATVFGIAAAPYAASTPGDAELTRPGRPARHAVVQLADGVELDLSTPAGDGPHPVVVYVHGGGWVSGDHRDIPLEFGLTELVEQGWAVGSVGYRAASASTGITVVDQVVDVTSAFRWVRDEGSTYGLGGPVVGVGHSAGAHLMAQVAATADAAARPDAVVLVSGIYDFEADVRSSPLLAQVIPVALGCGPATCTVDATRAEPARVAGLGDPSVQLVHGSDDPIAPLATATRYRRGLDDAGVPVTLTVVPGAGHDGDALGSAVSGVLALVVERSSRV